MKDLANQKKELGGDGCSGGSRTVGPQLPLDNADLPAIFWDSMPETAEQHADYAGLQAMAEESTLEERAENFKVQGNNKLRVGLKCGNKIVIREALQHYNSGLELKCTCPVTVAALLCNRAHIHSVLHNWRSALDDSSEALTLDPGNLKACFRGARAALKLGLFQRCEDLARTGLAVDPASRELQTLLQDSSTALAAVERERAKAAAAREAVEAPARALAAAIQGQGYKVTRPQVSLGERNKPILSPSGLLHWPLLLMYPEGGAQDAVEEAEGGDLLSDHLDMMFGPDSPPMVWDTHGSYSRERVELYYLGNAGPALTQQQLVCAMQGKWPEEGYADTALTRFGEGASTWQQVPESCTLHEVLTRPDHIIPGIPLFFVLAKGTAYRTKFLESTSALGAKRFQRPP
ncbi:MAG: hypothetical protein WDW36_009657 [Sanguina aurantia]